MYFLQLLKADINNSECEKQPELSDDVIVVTLTVLHSFVTCAGESCPEFYGFVYE